MEQMEAEAAGFPAHAGMDPSSPESQGGCGGVPRPRGDGPLFAPFINYAFWGSPPTRGWTPCNGTASTLFRGFPAHAGMDPSAP